MSKHINSEEKSTGRMLKIIGGGIMALTLTCAIFALMDGEIAGSAMLCVFAMFGGVFYGIGHHYSKKFAILGLTPLTLNTDHGVLGDKISGNIVINIPDFKSINTLSLKCLTSSHYLRSKPLWHQKL